MDTLKKDADMMCSFWMMDREGVPNHALDCEAEYVRKEEIDMNDYYKEFGGPGMPPE